ncbi:cytochrome P450 [Ceratobasidium sp. AG-I]|nr:cytochrome P450 [Ceratobasidium sp. AG-I]
MDSTNFQLAAAATASLAVIVPLLYYLLLPKPLPGIPHNPVTGLLGDLPELAQALKDNERSVGDYFNNHVKKHGPISQICFGSRVIVLLADRGEIDRLIVRGKNVDISTANRTVFAALVPAGMNALPANSTWKRHRRIAGPSMHRRYLSRMAVHISAGANGLVNLWKKKTQLAEGRAFETGFDIQLTTMHMRTLGFHGQTNVDEEVIANIGIGVPLRCTENALASLALLGSSSPDIVKFSLGEINPLFAAIRAVVAKVNRGLSLPFPGVIFPLLLRFSSTWRAQYKVLQEYLSKSIAEARKRQDVTDEFKGSLTTDAECMVDMFLQQESRDDTDGFNPSEMREELLVLFLQIRGGQETTASALSWFIKYMPTDPEIQRRLHKEITDVFGSDSDNLHVPLEQLDNVQQLPILEAVFVETLRCACVAAGIGRVPPTFIALSRIVTDDEVILGHRVPKDTELLIPLAYFGVSESEWGPDAETWRPGRWLSSDGSFNRDAGPDGDPFGLGHRVCFGQRLAVFQLKAYIIAMSRAFFFKPVPAEVASMKAVDSITRRPKICYASLEQWDA